MSTYQNLTQHRTLPAETQRELIAAATRVILREHGIFRPDDPEGLQIAGAVLQDLAQAQSVPLPMRDLLRLKKRVLSELSGYGFLDQLLPRSALIYRRSR